MVRVAPIKMQVGTKVLWFDPADLDIHAGDKVIVSTERGTEFACASADITEVSDELIEQLKSPLKPVLRLATEEDIVLAEELSQKSNEALPIFKEFAAQTNEDMHPVLVEFLFDGDKAIFYFEADERIDFRELVRKLAAHFHVRVDMRQIGVRDGARIIGGLGHCGQELCCKRLGGEFSPVSIRMAKEQNLSLNPQKISGVCGRLMCCLRYEYETYKEVNSRAPKLNSKVEVVGVGEAKVTEINVPCETVTLSLEDGQSVKVPLSEMEISGEGKRPNRVSAEVVERYSESNKYSLLESSATLEVAHFTAEEKLATKGSCTCCKNLNDEQERPRQTRRPRRRHRDGSIEAEEETATNQTTSSKKNTSDKQKNTAKKNAQRSNSRSRNTNDSSRSRSKKSSSQKPRNNSANNNANNENRSWNNSGNANNAARPGQKSSGLRNAPEKKQQNNNAGNQKNSSQTKPKQNAEALPHRKSRRRRHTTGGNQNENR